MNIKQAKEQIQNAMKAYFTKDSFGNYSIPIERQRPIFLMGPPGIGKTAIMEQVAAACGVGLVAYTMTHHTRQSAIGLPRIAEKVYAANHTAVTDTARGIVYATAGSMENRYNIYYFDVPSCKSIARVFLREQGVKLRLFLGYRAPPAAVFGAKHLRIDGVCETINKCWHHRYGRIASGSLKPVLLIHVMLGVIHII